MPKLISFGFRGMLIMIVVWAIFYPFFMSKSHVAPIELVPQVAKVQHDGMPYPLRIKPEFREIKSIEERKKAFLDYMTPAVNDVNATLRQKRQQLEGIISRYASSGFLTMEERVQLNHLARYCQKDSRDMDLEQVMALRYCVDEIPAQLVLMQAANESAWGTSRFAVDGNNYFGQWCFRKGCGLVPLERTSGNYEVAKFDSPEASIRSYFRNLNTHNAYRSLRAKRHVLRESNQIVTAQALAQELFRYSQRGYAYVDEITAMIRINQKYFEDE